MLVVGLISGTSADGVDVAIVDIKGKGESIKISEKAFRTYKFPDGLQDEIFRVSHEKVSAGEIAELNFRLGKFFADSLLKLVKESHIPLRKIKLIGSHGQTISHLPGKASLQIAEPSLIASITGKTTIADFRPADIAAGGEGAPLSCLLHYHLFKKRNIATLVINIGGISNFTLIPSSGKKEHVIAFDTGPGNMIIDSIVRFLTSGKKRFDKGGEIASKGKINFWLLNELLKHPFILKKPPKSTGREEFGEPIVKKLLRLIETKKEKIENIIATVSAFTAESIYLNYEKFIKPYRVSRIIITGGGVKNNFIMKLLTQKFSPVPIYTFEDFGLNSDSTEAVAFALLAYLTYYGLPGNIPSATGARRPAVLGKVVKP
jgi:anhydro-N-acetylmuramic acid kinase